MVLHMPKTPDLPAIYKQALVGKKAANLLYLLEKQVDDLFDELGIAVPAMTTSYLLYIGEYAPVSLAEMSRGLGEPHQVIAYHMPRLLLEGVLTKERSPTDTRVSLYRLTRRGKEQVELLRQYCRGAEGLFDELAKEIGFDVRSRIDEASQALIDRPIVERFDLINESFRGGREKDVSGKE